MEPLEIVGFEAVLSGYFSTRAWPPAVQCYKFIFVYFSLFENKFSNLFVLPLRKVWFGDVLSQIWREQWKWQMHPTAILQVVALMLPDAPGHFGIGAQEGLCVCLCAVLRRIHHRRVAVCVLGSGRCLWITFFSLRAPVKWKKLCTGNVSHAYGYFCIGDELPEYFICPLHFSEKKF